MSKDYINSNGIDLCGYGIKLWEEPTINGQPICVVCVF